MRTETPRILTAASVPSEDAGHATVVRIERLGGHYPWALSHPRPALLAAGRAPEVSATRADLLLARFERVDAAGFEALVNWERTAAAAGYGKLA